MLELRNRELRVEVLDPVGDAARLGPRYCWGGYIWQVHDAAGHPLLSGPEWPAPAPSAFNGQGLPESFRHRTLDGRPLTWHGHRGVAVGAGALALDAAGNVSLVEPCRWTITPHADRLLFHTTHDAAGFSYALQRDVELIGREVHSVSQLTNTSGDARLTLEWFAHPFFPLVDGVVRAQLPAGCRLPENPGFALAGRTLTQIRRFVRPDDGHMDRGLTLPPRSPIAATFLHPSCGEVHLETRFPPDTCVIWGNDRTFSLEPYLMLDLAPGETRRWRVSYRFGPHAGG